MMVLHIFRRAHTTPLLGTATTDGPWLGAVTYCGKTVVYSATVSARDPSGCTCEDCLVAFDADPDDTEYTDRNGGALPLPPLSDPDALDVDDLLVLNQSASALAAVMNRWGGVLVEIPETP